jgi:hypothetical protein
MKLKYYLRGLGIGIITTTIILAISFRGYEPALSDEEIMVRAVDLGMVMSHIDETQDTEIPDEVKADPVIEESHTEDLSKNSDSYRLVIESGEVARDVCNELADVGIIDDAESFRMYLREIGIASYLTIGTYNIPYGADFEEIGTVLKSGPLELLEDE